RRHCCGGVAVWWRADHGRDLPGTGLRAAGAYGTGSGARDPGDQQFQQVFRHDRLASWLAGGAAGIDAGPGTYGTELLPRRTDPGPTRRARGLRAGDAGGTGTPSWRAGRTPRLVTAGVAATRHQGGP